MTEQEVNKEVNSSNCAEVIHFVASSTPHTEATAIEMT